MSLTSLAICSGSSAVCASLQQLGYEEVEQVRTGKYICLTLTAESEAQARERLVPMCDRLLANPIIEDYRFELERVPSSVSVPS